jgi:diacylglycerol kinase family enzyme
MNGAAGTLAAARGALDASHISTAFANLGITADVRGVEGRELANAARQAASEGVDAVVAAGGDGTVSAVASALAGGSTPLGVLPLGTLNHFAKDAGVPLGLEAAVKAIVEGVPRELDVGEVNGLVFVNNSSIGLYPRMVQTREAAGQRLGRGRWSATVAASIAVFRRLPLMQVRLEFENIVSSLTVPFVFVGNNAYDMTLFRLGARARIDEGKLSLYVATCTSRWALIKLIFAALFNRLDQARDFVSRVTEELWVERGRRAFRVSLDGEVVDMPGPLHYRIRRGALRVLLPPPVVPDPPPTAG